MNIAQAYGAARRLGLRESAIAAASGAPRSACRRFLEGKFQPKHAKAIAAAVAAMLRADQERRAKNAERLARRRGVEPREARIARGLANFSTKTKKSVGANSP